MFDEMFEADSTSECPDCQVSMCSGGCVADMRDFEFEHEEFKDPSEYEFRQENSEEYYGPMRSDDELSQIADDARQGDLNIKTGRDPDHLEA